MASERELPLGEILIDRSVSVRRGDLDHKTIESYQENLEVLPPVDVFKVDDGYLLAAGFHRVEAHRRAGAEKIRANVHKGDREAALEFAAKADVTHGRPLTREEKAESVRRLVKLHPEWGKEELVKALSLSGAFIRAVQVEDQVRSSGAQTEELRPSYYREIHRAPRKHWKPLIEAALRGDWSVQETRAAVDRLKDRQTPDSIKEEILEGLQDPYVVREGGNPAYLTETVARRATEAVQASAMKPLRDALLAVEIFQDRHQDELWSNLDRKEAERLADSIKRAQGILDEAHEKLGEQLNRLEAVA